MGVIKSFTAANVLAALARAALAVLCLQATLLATPAWARGELLTLGRDSPASLAPYLEAWLDSTGQVSVEKVEAEAATLPFAEIPPGQKFQLDNAALWLRFDAVAQDPRIHWKVELPLSGIDKVTFYYRDSLGRWVTQRAGDSLPMSVWPVPGRFPVFTMNHEIGQVTAYYLRVEHARVPFSTLPQVQHDTELYTDRQLESLLLGAYFGLAGLAIFLALINAVAYRDWGFAAYAVHMAAFSGAQAAFAGVAGLYWWPEWPELNNASVVLLRLSSAASALWFVRTIATPKRFSRALDWFIVGLMGLLPVLAMIDIAFPTQESFTLIHVIVGAGIAALLMVIGVSLFEGDRHARWIVLGFLPIIIAAFFPILRNFGVLSSSFLTQNALLVGSAIEAPILFYGLLRRVTQRRESSARATTLRTTDPLTGLGSIKLLLAKLRQALSTAERYQQPCALLVIDLSNLSTLQQQHGRETGDRAMVLAAARIRAAAQPTDTVARVGDSQFALLMEGPMTSDGVNQVATKILASGLRPSRELPDADPLLFRIAIGYMGEPAKLAPTQPQAFLESLMKSVREMNDHSRKAIRMVYL